MASRTIYTTTVGGETVYSGDSLELAIRMWDHITHAVFSAEGGVGVQEYDAAGAMTRDGWLLHVEGGRTYLNPNIKVR